MEKPDPGLLARFGDLARPYWRSEEKRRAWFLLAMLLLLLVAETGANVAFNQRAGEFTSALAARDGPRFWRSIRIFCLLLAVAVPIYSWYYYVRDKLYIRWRRWLTHEVLTRYFADHAYYRLLKTPVDNPDQRIAEDIASFTMQSLNFMVLLAGAVLQLVAFSGVLWSISKSLVLFLAFYALAGTVITVGIFGRRMVSLYFQSLKREADFRFGLVRIRENAEAIALYRGEQLEQSHAERRFGAIVANFNDLITWGLRLNLFSYAYSLFTMALPSIIIAPRVLTGDLEVGRIVEAGGAFAAILGALTIFVDNLESLSRFAAGIGRLNTFLQRIGLRDIPNHGRIAVRESPNLGFENFTLQTPDYTRTLIKDLSFQVRPGEGLLVVGSSGCGKSSLLRSIAGLWDSGAGTLERPDLGELLFLPQQTYMILGSLREQLSYPKSDSQPSESRIDEVLRAVNLPELAERCGGLDAPFDFEKDLSAGERQRLAFARVLLNRPRYALLDEATSALDGENEEMLYRTLLEASTTIVSVSHHPALLRYHTHVLELTGNGEWTLWPVSAFRFRQELVEV